MESRELLGQHLINTLTPVVSSLVDQEDQVELTVSGKDTLLVSVFVAKEDRGQIIGRKGKTAEALRTLVNAVSAKHRMRALLEIVEND